MNVHMISLAHHRNAHAATFDGDRGAGFVNIWGNSFPAEEMPFAKTVLIGGVPYRIDDKIEGAPDHVEALGQRLEITAATHWDVLGVLGFGEMGPRTLTVTLTDRFGATMRVSAALPYWLAAAPASQSVAAWRASHLHYVGGYELDRLRPAMFSVTEPLPRAMAPVFATLEPNPAAHVMALTLMQKGRGHG